VAHRSPRSDGRENRERLILAGAEVLIADGPGATVHAIVQRAGVSETLFFSHFASKDDLIAELVTARLIALREIAQQSDTLDAYIWAAAENVAPHRAYLEAANHHGVQVEPPRASLDFAVNRLIAGADVRPGVTAEDVHALIMIGTLAAAPYLHARPGLWRRYVGLLAAGLKT
jgi:AcrR family transcriptional regulator